jgi:hypothetical protein
MILLRGGLLVILQTGLCSIQRPQRPDISKSLYALVILQIEPFRTLNSATSATIYSQSLYDKLDPIEH